MLRIENYIMINRLETGRFKRWIQLAKDREIKSINMHCSTGDPSSKQYSKVFAMAMSPSVTLDQSELLAFRSPKR